MKPQTSQTLTVLATLILGAALPMYAIRWGGSAWWPATTAIFLSVLIGFGASLRSRRNRVGVVFAVCAFLMLANCLVAVSYSIQRAGINQQFVDQLNWNTRFALRGYYGTAIAAMLYVGTVSIAAVASSHRLAPRAIARYRWLWAVMLLGAFLAFTPTAQTLAFLHSKSAGPSQVPSVGISRLDPGQPPEPSAIGVAPQRSLVLIYLEGIETAFLNTPGLMPRLEGIRHRMIDFNNIRQVVGGTIGGIVATQCGWPPYSGSSLFEDPEFYPGFECLGDLLQAQGYTSVFLGGADLRFTAKGRFFTTHGFSSVAGLKELRPLLPDRDYVSKKWGIWDDTLFEIGRARFDELAGDGKPFLLVFLTIATHTPGFAAPTCPDYAGSDDQMLKAVHCTDLLVAEFIEHVRQSDISDDVLIALVSDHLMWGGIEPLGIASEPGERRLMFLVDDPRQPGRSDPVAGTEFEIGPTLADLMGVSRPHRIGLGSSLLHGQGFLLSPESGLNTPREIERFLRSDQVKGRLEQARSKKQSGSG